MAERTQVDGTWRIDEGTGPGRAVRTALSSVRSAVDDKAERLRAFHEDEG